MKRIIGIFKLLEGYVYKSLASTRTEDKQADAKIKAAIKQIWK
jgi:hypothetical protein